MEKRREERRRDEHRNVELFQDSTNIFQDFNVSESTKPSSANISHQTPLPNSQTPKLPNSQISQIPQTSRKQTPITTRAAKTYLQIKIPRTPKHMLHPLLLPPRGDIFTEGDLGRV
jgi:hypothetical protein